VAAGLNELSYDRNHSDTRLVRANTDLFFSPGFIKSSWMQIQSIQLPWLLIPFTRMFNETKEVYPFWHLINSPLKAPAFRKFWEYASKKQRNCDILL